MDTRPQPALARLIARAEHDPEVLALILFGSRARGESRTTSDVDVCLVLAGTEPSARSRKRLEYLAEAEVDLSVFQDLPLALQTRVLGEGKVLCVRDEDALYDLAARAVRAFEDFRHIHREYLDRVASD